MLALEKIGLGLLPEIRQSGRRMDFDLNGKIGENGPAIEKWPENPFAGNCSAIFLISGPFFPYFRSEAAIHSSAIFSFFGREAETDFLPDRHVHKKRFLFGVIRTVLRTSQNPPPPPRALPLNPSAKGTER